MSCRSRWRGRRRERRWCRGGRGWGGWCGNGGFIGVDTNELFFEERVDGAENERCGRVSVYKCGCGCIYTCGKGGARGI